ncbi:Alkyl hydroperoxide reductase/ Thiol specific antioxidant/ Mal allergen [Sulfitobacter noctilucicola]|uniref:Peroxiredoxin n=1 Tax=Sulfitobacter noctilucicola TaxID=1342301 RepID=A0A7W6M555_9RHOB|nr:redoxin domain-containing protein [Sulfitobacter noctilucicola]KIN62899.1 Alkyl hydroperoxide reductase/ Thiol specific antioxidant/ Mal allergen [Sulfitobacter noctilucicola]MBB4172571.1 peroxiredoxin [Sulfitobacter noctilucicola]
MPTPKPVPGSILSPMTFMSVKGGEIVVGGKSENWTLLVVYRGKHCPRCKKYLNTLSAMHQDWVEAGFDIVVVSADSLEKAKADQEEFGWSFDLGYGLTESQMATLGVYVTEPLSPDEADGNFAEPGTFVLRPDGSQIIVAISNGPAVRPDLAELLDGMIFNKTKDRPHRGTV